MHHYTGWTNGVGVNFEWMRRRPAAAVHGVLDRLVALRSIARVREDVLAKQFARRSTADR